MSEQIPTAVASSLVWHDRTHAEIRDAALPSLPDGLIYGWMTTAGTIYAGEGYPVPPRSFSLDNVSCAALLVRRASGEGRQADNMAAAMSYREGDRQTFPASQSFATDGPTVQLARHRDRDRVTALAKCGLLLSFMNREGHCFDGFDEFGMYNDVVVALEIEDHEDPDLTMTIIGEGEEFGLTLLDTTSQPVADVSADSLATVERVETLEGALREISTMRPAGDVEQAKGTRNLVKRMERIAVDALRAEEAV